VKNERRIPGDDRRLLGDLLIEAGVASRAGVAAGLEEQKLRGGRLGFNLMKIGKVVPISFHFFLQDGFPVLVPELAEAMQRSPAIDLIPAGLAHHYFMVPVQASGGVLDLAVTGADSPLLIPALQELTGMKVEPLISPPSFISDALSRFYPGEIAPGVIYRPSGENTLVLSDGGQGIRPSDPEMIPEGAPPPEWLRGIAARALDRRARRIRLEPQPDSLQVWFQGTTGTDSGLTLPGGTYPGVASLIEGLSGIAARPRSAPREGRIALSARGRARVAATVQAEPGFEGHSYTIDLREEAIASPSRDRLGRDMPALAASLRHLAEERRGLVLLAGPGQAETEAGLSAVLTLLGDALPRRIAVATRKEGASEDAPSASSVPASLIDAALRQSPDLLIATELGRADDPRSALALAGDRVVIAPLTAVDAFDAAEQIACSGQGRAAESIVAGILGSRLIETLCRSCGVPYDLLEVVPPSPHYRAIPAGEFSAGAGCAACRGSGVLNLQPVFEFLRPLPDGSLFRRGCRAPVLREDRLRDGEATLVTAALHKASLGQVDVREPLRLMLHERH
jgi:hypothetical protein